MGGTSIKRKARKNLVKAKRRIDNVKRLTFKPVLKNINIEEVKASFNKKSKTPEKVEVEPVVTVQVEKPPKNVKTEKAKTDTLQDEKKKKIPVDQEKNKPSAKATKEKKKPGIKKEEKATEKEDKENNK